MNFAEAISYIEGALKFGINPGLEKIRAICERLDNPQLKYPTIQITGTNGKTSTTWMSRTLLTTSGLRTGCYTSPHLHTYRERITIDGELITEEDFARALYDIMPAVEKVRAEYGELTEFEILTAMAFYHFAVSGVDVAVFEVGLGGRWDATSMVQPRVAAITSIALDHTDRLGETVEEIAWDKAHIIKRGSIAIIGETPPGAFEKIKERCEAQDVSMILYGRDFSSRGVSILKNEGSSFSIDAMFGIYEDIRLPVFGDYQVSNFTLAVVIVETFTGHRIEEDTLHSSLVAVTCPGRLEFVSSNPAVVLDGAHNPDGMAMLLAGLPKAFDYDRLLVVLAVSNDKDIKQMLETLGANAHKLILTQNTSYRSASVNQLNDIAMSVTNSYSIEADLEKAIDKAVSMAGARDLVCITGSLYTVADAREILVNKRMSYKSTAQELFEPV